MMIAYMQYEKILPNLQALAQNGNTRRILVNQVSNPQNLDLKEQQNIHYLTK
jgi:hypothetical protein